MQTGPRTLGGTFSPNNWELCAQEHLGQIEITEHTQRCSQSADSEIQVLRNHPLSTVYSLKQDASKWNTPCQPCWMKEGLQQQNLFERFPPQLALPFPAHRLMTIPLLPALQSCPHDHLQGCSQSAWLEWSALTVTPFLFPLGGLV